MRYGNSFTAVSPLPSTRFTLLSKQICGQWYKEKRVHFSCSSGMTVHALNTKQKHLLLKLDLKVQELFYQELY